MYGAIAGDIIGSETEFDPIKTKDFELFTSGCGFTENHRRFFTGKYHVKSVL